jgi:HlyD family secretion protein
MRSPWLRRLAVAAAVVVVGTVLRLTIFRPADVPVTVFRVARGVVEETVTNSKAGKVASRHRATLSTEIGGRVARLPVRKGTRVRAGDVLVQLADADVRAQLALQERSADAVAASEREACARADQADKDLARSRALAEDRVISAAILDSSVSARDAARAACDAAHARVRQARAAVDLARVDLRKTVLRAPFDGVVAELTTEVGEWITPSPPGLPIPPVVELISAADLYVSAPLDEVDVGRVKDGQTVRVTMDAYPGRSFPGRVVRVAPYVLDVQEQNRTFEIEVELDDAAFARTLVPGSSADVEVVLDTHVDAMRVPSHAVLEGTKVLVVRDGRLVAVPVKTGLKNWAFTEIREGLTPGDLVVVTFDDPAVKEGARVRIAGETRS